MHLIPALTRPGTGRHRPATRTQLQAENRSLRHQHASTERDMDALWACIRQTANELGTSVVTAAEERAGREEERAGRLSAEADIADLRQRMASLQRKAVIDVPKSARDTTALEDQATVPIPREALAAALAAAEAHAQYLDLSDKRFTGTARISA